MAIYQKAIKMQTSTSITIGTTTIHQSDNGLYLITDLWKASGSLSKDLPQKWLELKSTQKYLRFLNAIPETGSISKSSEIITTGEKSFHGTYVCEELVYSYAMWISCEYHHLVITTFKDFVNADSFEEIKALKYKLDNAKQQDFFAPERQPRHEGCLQVILKCTPFQAEFYHDELIKLGQLENEYDEVIEVRRRKVKITESNTCVTGKTSSGALIYDEDELRRLLDIPKQTEWM
jgi:hypothetical protein